MIEAFLISMAGYLTILGTAQAANLIARARSRS